jgi:hypothetical protein
MLNGRAAVGLGGIGGLLFVVLFVPSYLSAPDTPIATSGPQALSTTSPTGRTES